MAKRASEAFVVATPKGKLRFAQDQIVPNDLAKGLGGLVYDDGAPAPAAARKG
jgi:hypothetical protein